MTQILKLMKMIPLAAVLAVPAKAGDDFEERVIEAILNNPEIVLLALERMQDAQDADDKAQVEAQIAAEAQALFGGPEQYELLEFFDYRCSYCSEAAETIRSLDDVHAQKIRLLEFPILGEASHEIAKVSRAVRNVYGAGAYVEFHNAVFERSGRINNSAAALRLAEELSLDRGVLERAASDSVIEEELLRNRRLAVKLGISGTPAFVSRDLIHEGVMDAKDIVKVLLRKDDNMK